MQKCKIFKYEEVLIYECLQKCKLFKYEKSIIKLMGAIFPWSSVPVPMQVIMAINPVFYGVEAIRFILTRVANIPMYVSLLVISVFSAILIYLGGRSFTKIEAS